MLPKFYEARQEITDHYYSLYSSPGLSRFGHVKCVICNARSGVKLSNRDLEGDGKIFIILLKIMYGFFSIWSLFLEVYYISATYEFAKVPLLCIESITLKHKTKLNF